MIKIYSCLGLGMWGGRGRSWGIVETVTKIQTWQYYRASDVTES